MLLTAAAAGLIGVAVGVTLSAILLIYYLWRKDRESPDDDWPDREDAKDDTVALIYEHAKDSPSDQLHDLEQLDTKTTAVFAAATVALGLAARLTPRDHELKFLTDSCIYLATGFWVLAAVAGLFALRTRSLHRTLQADDLFPEYGAHNPESFKRLVVRDAARAYYKNRPVLKRKAYLFNIAALATGMESLLIVIALVLSR